MYKSTAFPLLLMLERGQRRIRDHSTHSRISVPPSIVSARIRSISSSGKSFLAGGPTDAPEGISTVAPKLQRVSLCILRGNFEDSSPVAVHPGPPRLVDPASRAFPSEVSEYTTGNSHPKALFRVYVNYNLGAWWRRLGQPSFGKVRGSGFYGGATPFRSI